MASSRPRTYTHTPLAASWPTRIYLRRAPGALLVRVRARVKRRDEKYVTAPARGTATRPDTRRRGPAPHAANARGLPKSSSVAFPPEGDSHARRHVAAARLPRWTVLAPGALCPRGRLRCDDGSEDPAAVRCASRLYQGWTVLARVPPGAGRSRSARLVTLRARNTNRVSDPRSRRQVQRHLR